MTILVHRRGALRVMTSVLALGAVLHSGAGFASVLPTAFIQALTAAAGNDTVTADFYRNRDYLTLWTGPLDAPRREILLQAFDAAGDHALPVTRYDATSLRKAFSDAQTEGDLGRLEITMTKAFLAYARDLSSGALEPGHVDDGIKRVIARPDPALMLPMAGGDLAVFLVGLAPQAPEFAFDGREIRFGTGHCCRWLRRPYCGA
jgi:hypothetical protein